MAAAVRALLSLLSKPLPDAVSAAEFRARRAEHGVLNLTITDKALEYLLDIGVGI